MKKTSIGFHKNIPAPRSPLLDSRPPKPLKNTNRSASNQGKIKDKSKSKPHSTKGKGNKVSQSPLDKDKIRSKGKKGGKRE